MRMRMRRAGGTYCLSAWRNMYRQYVFHVYRASQTHVFPVLAFTPHVPINGTITFNGTQTRVEPILGVALDLILPRKK